MFGINKNFEFVSLLILVNIFFNHHNSLFALAQNTYPDINNGKIVRLNSIDDFCLLMPKGPDITIGVSEGDAISYCTTDDLTQGARRMENPGSFITGAHFVKGPDYVQITGALNYEVFGLVNGDDGGMYDDAPKGSEPYSFCEGYASYVEIISYNLYCMRCCEQDEHSSGPCDMTRDTAGCWNVIGGSYELGYTNENQTVTPSWLSETVSTSNSNTQSTSTNTASSSSSSSSNNGAVNNNSTSDSISIYLLSKPLIAITTIISLLAFGISSI